MSTPAAAARPGGAFPRPPAYAWAWFQRSRPVLHEAAVRLTGGPPGPAFVQRLREDFERDPFARDVVIGVVADVAFSGRAPSRRPPGASWDRGLVWWAAAIAGTTAAAFEARSQAPPGEELRLFPPPAHGAAARAGRPPPGSERARLAGRLRELLAVAAGDQVPASAVRQLLAELEQRREG